LETGKVGRAEWVGEAPQALNTTAAVHSPSNLAFTQREF
jgi:hypothetical protein